VIIESKPIDVNTDGSATPVWEIGPFGTLCWSLVFQEENASPWKGGGGRDFRSAGPFERLISV